MIGFLLKGVAACWRDLCFLDDTKRDDEEEEEEEEEDNPETWWTPSQPTKSSGCDVYKTKKQNKKIR